MKTLLRSACVAVLVLLLVGTASPAVAKGPLEVAVSGPGVDTTMNYYTKSVVDVDMGSLGEAARIYDVYGTYRPAPTPGVSKGALGARYVLTWDMGDHDIVQHAYPFAEGGAWVHFLPGQQLFGKPVADGWSSAPALTDQLIELGAVDNETEAAVSSDAEVPAETSELPEQEPALAAVDDETGGSTSYDVAVPAGLVLAGLLAVGVLLWRRRVSR
jgi:hypothetical protein